MWVGSQLVRESTSLEIGVGGAGEDMDRYPRVLHCINLINDAHLHVHLFMGHINCKKWLDIFVRVHRKVSVVQLSPSRIWMRVRSAHW